MADLACEELGMIGSEDEDKRGAYADDVTATIRGSDGVWRLRTECGQG